MAVKRNRKIKKALTAIQTQESIELARAGEDETPFIDVDLIDPTEDAEYETTLERIYGRRGPPEDNILRLPPSINKPNPGLPFDRPPGKMINGIMHSAKCICKICKSTVRKVTVMQDSLLTYPDLFFSIYIATDSRYEEAQFAEMFTRSRCHKAASPSEADVVVFTGGADVSPTLYGEPKHSLTRCDPVRDRRDIALYKHCLEEGIPMFGVCRGAQFLHVMNGGKLYQNVTEHVGDHSIWDVINQEFIEKTSSVHHQAVRVNTTGGMSIIATTNNPKSEKLSVDEKKEKFIVVDQSNPIIEAFFYRHTGCFGVQGHPEYRGYNRFTQWTLDHINNLFYMSPDFEWKDSHYRMKAELVAERAAVIRPSAKLFLKMGVM